MCYGHEMDPAREREQAPLRPALGQAPAITPSRALPRVGPGCGQPHQRSQAPDLDLVLAGATPAPVPALLEALALVQAPVTSTPRQGAEQTARKRRDATEWVFGRDLREAAFRTHARNATLAPVLLLQWPTYIVGKSENKPPIHGLGLLIPETPAEMRDLAICQALPALEEQRYAQLSRIWSGVTLEEVTRALLARHGGTWHHWGPFMPGGEPWPWSSLPKERYPSRLSAL